MSLWAFRFLLWYLCILLVQPQNRFIFLWPFRLAMVSMVAAIILHAVATAQENRPFIRFGPATRVAFALMFFSFIANQTGPFQSSTAWNSDIDIIFKNSICLILIEAMATTVQRVWAVYATMLISTLWWLKGGLRLSASGAYYSGDRLMGPAVSLIENPNGFAFMMALMIPIYLYFFQNAKNKWLRWGFLACAISAIFITLRTGSRTGLLCLIAAGIFLLPKYGAKHKVALITIGAASFLFMGSIGAMNIERYKSIGHSISEFFAPNQEDAKDPAQMTDDEHSAYERKMKNKDSWGLIKRYPLGVGVHKSDEFIPEDLGWSRGQVHNDWLYVGVQMGFIGMALYAGLMWCVFAFSSRIQREAKNTWPALSDLGWTTKMMGVVFVVGGFFSPIGWNPLFLATAGATSALWLNFQNKSWNRETESF